MFWKLLSSVIVLCSIGSSVYAAVPVGEPFSQFILTAPPVKTPFSAMDLIPTVQGGVTHSIPLVNFNVVSRRTVTTGSSTDVVKSNDFVILWNSATALPKTETIPGCSALLDNRILEVSDEIGTAFLLPITIVPSVGTIAFQPTAIINTNGSSIDMQCDASTTNWVIK
jgi:hypothetical protein